MPNVGRPSRDCQTCRQTHTKCDLKRPACTQCLRKKVLCPGYQDALTARLRIENIASIASKKGKGRRSKRPAQRSPVFHPLTESWDTHFFPFLMHNVQSGHSLAEDVYNVIPFLFGKAHPASAFYQACNAVARKFLAQKLHSSKALSDDLEAHGTVITTIQSAIRHPQQVKSDDTLLAIWYLTVYELLQARKSGSGNSVVVPLAYKLHCRAIAGLIKMRGPDQFKTRQGRKLFLVIFSNVELSAYVTGEKWEEATSCFRIFYQYCDPAEYPTLRACIFSHQCARLIGRIQRLLDAGEQHEILSNLTSITQEIDQVENINTYPPVYGNLLDHYKMEPPQVPYTTPDPADDYQFCASAQYLQSTFRMRLSYHMLPLLRCASHLPACTTEQQEQYKKLQNHYIEEILSLANRALHTLARPSRYPLPSQADISNADKAFLSLNKERTTEKMTVMCCINFEEDPKPSCTLVLRLVQSGLLVIPQLFEIYKS